MEVHEGVLVNPLEKTLENFLVWEIFTNVQWMLLGVAGETQHKANKNTMGEAGFLFF